MVSASPTRPAGEAAAAGVAGAGARKRAGALGCVVFPQHLRWLRLQPPRELQPRCPGRNSLGQSRLCLVASNDITEISNLATLSALWGWETRLLVSPAFASSHCTVSGASPLARPRVYSAPTPRRPRTMPAPMTAQGVRASVLHSAGGTLRHVLVAAAGTHCGQPSRRTGRRTR